MSDESAESFDNQTPLEILKSSRENVNWEKVDERRKFIRRVYSSIERWGLNEVDDTADPPPNIQDVFRSEEIECLVMDYINLQYMKELEVFVIFVARSGYKDEPRVDADGMLSSLRTTPVHHAAKQNRRIIRDILIRQIFKIYNRYDVNYTDESGLSHFHVACMYGYYDAVMTFLELGQDPNCLWTETGDSPLRMAVLGRRTEVVQLLVRSGADPNLANKEGSTSLHFTSNNFTNLFFRIEIPNDEKTLFEISDELNRPLQVDARAKFGNTPLHVSVVNDNVDVTEMLLRRGADPNSANDEGSTPLHLFYKRDSFFYDVKGSVELFFKICDEVNQSVQVNVVDNLGRTPLQLAVANLWPDGIDILFERGADLSNFMFPTESYFAERYKSFLAMTPNCRLKLASSALAVVEKIENRGYELKRSDAVTIMKFFAKYRLFEKSSDREKCWYDDEKFIKKAKEIWICHRMSHIPNIQHDIEWFKIREEMKLKPNLPLDEVVRLRPEEAAKILTYVDYWKFACSYHLMIHFTSYLDCGKMYEELSALHLCEKLSRGFFQSWALDPLWQLIHKRLPILCCDMIIDHLSNEDLCNICLAAAGQSS